MVLDGRKVDRKVKRACKGYVLILQVSKRWLNIWKLLGIQLELEIKVSCSKAPFMHPILMRTKIMTNLDSFQLKSANVKIIEKKLSMCGEKITWYTVREFYPLQYNKWIIILKQTAENLSLKPSPSNSHHWIGHYHFNLQRIKKLISEFFHQILTGTLIINLFLSDSRKWKELCISKFLFNKLLCWNLLEICVSVLSIFWKHFMQQN